MAMSFYHSAKEEKTSVENHINAFLVHWYNIQTHKLNTSVLIFWFVDNVLYQKQKIYNVKKHRRFFFVAFRMNWIVYFVFWSRSKIEINWSMILWRLSLLFVCFTSSMLVEQVVKIDMKESIKFRLINRSIVSWSKDYFFSTFLF